MVKLIIFDTWGTLIANGIYSPVKQVKFMLDIKDNFPEYIKRFEHVFMTKEYKSLEEGFKAVLKEFGIKQDKEIIEKLIGAWNKNTLLARPFRETIQVLEDLKKDYKLALISNTDSFSVPQVIEKFGIEKLFDYVYLSCKEGKLKTETESFQKILKKLKVDSKDAVMIGDSIESDIKGAELAGIRAILLDRRGRRDYIEKIMDLSELREKL
ncbi:MAG: HAD family hydrolase [Candidatus Woesearchaeota archaeon]